jgi:hypothetical protein
MSGSQPRPTASCRYATCMLVWSAGEFTTALDVLFASREQAPERAKQEGKVLATAQTSSSR